MLTLSHRHFIPDDDTNLMRLRGDAHHDTGRLRNVLAVLASAKHGQW